MITDATTTPSATVHPLDYIHMEVDSRWAAGREYYPAVTIDIKKHAWHKAVYKLNEKMRRKGI